MSRRKKTPPPRVLISAGPTRAYLDEVRYLSNHSSGELGFHLGRELTNRGAQVAMVAGVTSMPFRSLGFSRLVEVETNREMLAAFLKLCETFRPHHAIFAAAVLDFEPVRQLTGKVSSKKKHWDIRLKPAPKIVDEVRKRFPEIKRIGFKLEAVPLSASQRHRFAKKILAEKGYSALCLNFLKQVKKKHQAYVYLPDGRCYSATGKKQIASKLSQLVLSESVDDG